MIENTIHDFVKTACQKQTNVLTDSFFKEHIALVVSYSKKLCDILNADKEIVSLSAYLHDISAVLDFKTLATHNLNSAEIAKELLSQNNYPKNKIEKISLCIVNHSSPVGLNDGTTEEICLSNADAISQIVNPGYWLYFAFKIRNLNYNDGKNWYLSRIDDNWSKLIDPAKKLIEPDYWRIKEAIR